jgi:hypothetical protein
MKSESTSTGELFDRLSSLYQKDPEEFERVTKNLILKTLDAGPEEFRAKGYGIQLRIEQRLAHFKDPVARMNEMVVIFWEQFQKFQDVLNDPLGAVAAGKKSGPLAKVIPIIDRTRPH